MANTRTVRIVGRVVKSIFTALLFGVCGILVWRLFSSGDPDSVKFLKPNAMLLEAYEEHGDELILQYQYQDSITLAEYTRGYFSVTQYVFIPQAKQVQLVFRYNNSTIQHLAEDYGLSDVPSKEEHLFEVSLVTTTDLTPDNREDNAEASQLKMDRYIASDYHRDTTALYTYYRYVFDNVEITEDMLYVFADVYYTQDVNYEEHAYGTLCLYDDESEWVPYKMTSADVAALKKLKED